MIRYRWFAIFLLLSSCAGLTRSCDDSMATSFGANWVVVQYAADGHPINCWKLQNTSISNEHASDGIYWADRGNLVHISGWYNRVQVSGSSSFDEAATLIGVDIKRCTSGVYTLSLNNDSTK